MNDFVRKAFEEVCFPSFGRTFAYGLRRKPNGEYVSDALEDHWQTFQEGWEEAIKYIAETKDYWYVRYKDSDGSSGVDSR
jgi:hypothetical protein